MEFLIFYLIFSTVVYEDSHKKIHTSISEYSNDRKYLLELLKIKKQ